MKINPPRRFTKYCTINGTAFENFGINKTNCLLYGKSINDIVLVEMIISKDQERKEGYWGWFDYEKKEFTIVFNGRLLLETSFQYGIKSEEKAKRGIAYRLTVLRKL
jgi:hypothetical protein